MCARIIAFAIVLSCLISTKVHVQGCKLYCVSCPHDISSSNYYCCMEDWEDKPNVRDCGFGTSSTESSTASSTEATTLQSPDTTTLSTPSTTTCNPTPSMCPYTGGLSDEDCKNYMRIHPHPLRCSSSSDCPEPFNACCDDKCYNANICKTYRDSFNPPDAQYR